ncbi:hypothetical protein [Mycobacterium ulcerans]|uniref:hypothetical protein n=1 Tax=Mycobacterium ulcerans TaxID=1809 RepID=UPI0018D50483|nr:hypothetical protein [Mycobacterium ulcerans]
MKHDGARYYVNAHLLQCVDRVGGILSAIDDLFAVRAELIIRTGFQADENPAQTQGSGVVD